MIKKFTVHTGEGKHNISLIMTITAEGIIIHLFGGEKPHVGGVVVCLPHKKLNHPEQISYNSIVIPLLGHKDDELAKPVAEHVARLFNQPVVVIAGVHIKRATAQDIHLLKENTKKALHKLCVLPGIITQ